MDERSLDSPFDEIEIEPEPWNPSDLTPEDRFFETDDGVKLHYLDWPADPGVPVVVMVHGRRAHSRWFDPVAPGLSPAYRCLALDLRGHGESESNGEPASLDRYGNDLAQFLAHLSGERLILVLHSMAGRIGILAHDRYGQTPDLLVMADAPLYRRPHHARPEAPFRPKRYPKKEFAIRRFRLMPLGSAAHPDLLRYLAEHSLRKNEDGTWDWKFDEETSSRPFGSDFRDAAELGLESIDCPTLVIYGEHSALVDSEEAQRTAARLPKAQVVELPDSFHHLMLDRPGAFNAALREFFARNGF